MKKFKKILLSIGFSFLALSYSLEATASDIQPARKVPFHNVNKLEDQFINLHFPNTKDIFLKASFRDVGFSTRDNRLIVLNNQGEEILGFLNNPDLIYWSPSDDSYVTQKNNVLNKIDLNGNILWTYRPEEEKTRIYLLNVAKEGTIYFSQSDSTGVFNTNSKLISLGTNGIEKWNIAGKFEFRSINEQGDLFLIKNLEDNFGHEKKFISVSPNGEELWQIDFSYRLSQDKRSDSRATNVTLSPNFPQDKTVYRVEDLTQNSGATFLTRVLAIDTETGNIKWDFIDDQWGYYSGIQFDLYGNLYFMNFNRINKLTSDGTLVWKKDSDNGYGYPIVLANSSILFNEPIQNMRRKDNSLYYHQRLHLLDQSGNEKWSFDVSNFIPSKDRKQIFVSVESEDSYEIKSLTTENGEVNWSLKSSGVMSYSLSPEDKIYIIESDGKIFTIDSSIHLNLNGKEILLDQPPLIKNDSTIVPLREIFEELGAKVVWNDLTKTITATKADTTITLKINSTDATVNGKQIILNQAPVIIQDKTMVPVRFISESFGAKVSWDGNTNTVLINTQ
ncbi:stalk domain-containing protein [Paenibacillus sp. LjRoot153]|uniref:stalk domain-containing protein n=1 Tax=Paenibacillus sp. LjRoot153 TaxID=3342270 RepID=UPI003ED010EB